MSRFVNHISHQFSAARPANRAGLILLVLAAFSVVGTSAWAYWTTFGSGSASATTGTLNPPTGVVATNTAGSSTVGVGWDAPLTGTPPTGYYVTRIKNIDSSTAAACASSADSLIAGPSCNDLAVPDGTFHYTVTAVYLSWSATNGASGDVTVTSSIATTTTVSSSLNPSVVGQSVMYTATVTPNSGSTTPIGPVTFKDGGATIACTGGNLTLNGSGVATCQLTYSGAGTHSITAVYAGAGSFTASASTSLAQAVNKASTTTSVVSSANPSMVGQSVTYTATVAVSAPGAGTPTGNVEFFDGGTPIGTCGGATGNPLSGTTASCSQTYATVSSHTITAQYLGSTDYIASAASASLTQTVSTSLAIATVVNDHGNIKVHFTGTGAAATTTITVTICALNSFPCAIPIADSTASNPPAGNWTSETSSKKLNAGTTYYAQAVQGTTSSAVFSFSPPP